jgi:hypothetical protein
MSISFNKLPGATGATICNLRFISFHSFVVGLTVYLSASQFLLRSVVGWLQLGCVPKLPYFWLDRQG